MASPSKSGLKTSLCNNLKPHVFETFDPAEDFEPFQKHVILPFICNSHYHQYVHYADKPTLPPLVVFDSSQCSIQLVHKLLLDTDVNLANGTPFIHYVNYPPCQSVSIPITRHFSTHGYFSPNIPGCFISDHKNGFLKKAVGSLSGQC